MEKNNMGREKKMAREKVCEKDGRGERTMIEGRKVRKK